MGFAPALTQERVCFWGVDIEVIAVLFQKRDRLLARLPAPGRTVITFDQSQGGRHVSPSWGLVARECQILAKPEPPSSLSRPLLGYGQTPATSKRQVGARADQ